MDFITRKLKVNDFKEVVYPVYSTPEADEKGLEYSHWKDCQAGQLGVSDDGFVAECINIKIFKNAVEMQFPYGKMWLGDRYSLLYIPHKESGNYSQVTAKTYDEVEAAKSRTERAVQMYTTMFLSGEGIDWNILGEIYRKDEKRPDMSAKRLFKNEKVKAMVTEELKKVFDDKGISEGDVIEIITDAIEIAREKEDPGTMLRGSEQFIKLMDMYPNKSVQTETLQIDVSNKILDEIESEEKRLLATRTKEVESGQ